MNIEEFRDYCLAKPHTEEGLPFGDDTLVFKVAGKIFAMASLSNYESGVALKCNPDWAIELREQYPSVQPGYHMNKKHWNTILPEGFLPMGLFQNMIDHSYSLVINGLSRKQKEDMQFD